MMNILQDINLVNLGILILALGIPAVAIIIMERQPECKDDRHQCPYKLEGEKIEPTLEKSNRVSLVQPASEQRNPLEERSHD